MQGNWMNQPYQGQYGQQQQLPPQQTGFQPLQGQRTGFQPQQQFQPQQTGFLGGGLRPQLPLQGQPTGYAPLQRPMATGYPGPQPSYGGGPPAQTGPSGFGGSQLLQSQPTGFPGAMGGMGVGGGVGSQFISTFLPASNLQPSPYMNPSQMQFAAPAIHGQQSFQQMNQAQTGQSTVAIPWALTPDEKKRYDQIFRAWDQQGAGFIGGAVAQEVFGQAGLERDDLMAIWNLADVEDRGKLNIDEFHVAMGLIYRKLNGNPIPQTLPPEMVPPSARGLADSVDFLTGLLKHDTNQRSTSATGDRGSMAKSRTLHSGNEPQQSNRKDATVYKHDDDDHRTYKSSRRHIDRDAVRFKSMDSDSNSDLEDVKRSFKKSESLVEKSRAKDEEEESLKDELRDLKKRIERLNDDLEYNLSRRPRTSEKDDQKRRIERELLMLEHEELPILQRKMEDFQREKKREKSKATLERDRRNDKYGGKYDDDYSSSRDYDRERERERDRRDDGYRSRDDSRERTTGYTRGTYDNNRDHDRPRDRDYDREDRRDRSSRSSPSATRDRTPPPPPPPVAIEKPAPPAPTPPVPTPSPAPSASMTPAERQAHIRAEAQRRIQDRLRALGVASPSSSPAPEIDTSVADRLEAEKAEAARKAAKADEEIKEKERLRSEKLERERGRGAAIEQAIQSPSTTSTPTAPATKVEEDPELAALERAREERLAKVKQLEQEIADAKAAEENFLKSKAKFASSASSSPKVPPPPPPSRSRAPPPKPQPRAIPCPVVDDEDFAAPPPRVSPPVAFSPPPVSTPVVPPPPSAPPAPEPPKNPTNPFYRVGSSGASTPASTSATPTAPKPNPFFAAGAAAAIPAAPTPPPAPPAPQPFKQSSVSFPPPPKPAFRAPPPPDDDWDSPREKEGSDSSSDEEDFSSRATRKKLAQTIFSQVPMSAPARPSSAQATGDAPRSTPAPPPAPPAPFAPPPPAPFAPPPPSSSSAPSAAPVGRPAALLGDIQKGLKLKKTQTVDKSGPSVTGAVIGDASPPVQKYVPPPSPPPAPREPSPPPPSAQYTNGDADAAQKDFMANRQSVDWYGGLASSASEPVAAVPKLAVQEEEEEPVEDHVAPLAPLADEDPLDAVNLSITHRMRSLYAYEGQRPEDLTFPENVVIVANPPKDGESPWWYGTIETTGHVGWVPKSYIEEISASSGKATYAYTATSADELSFEEGDLLEIVDTSDADWWKAEKGGIIGVVPASYFELQNSSTSPVNASPPSRSTPRRPPPPPSPAQVHEELAESSEEEDDSDDDSDTNPTKRDPKEIERERLRVLEVAGLLVRTEAGDDPTQTLRRRRAAPARPVRPSISISHSSDAVPPRDEPSPQQERMEDAYDLYQRVMRDLPAVPPRDSHELTQELSRTSSHISPPPSPVPSLGSSTTTRQSAASSLFSRVVTGISRSSASSAASDRPRPTISGPVSSPVIGGPGDRKSGHQAVGSSWASLIDQSALDNLPDGERKRQEAIFEFIATEQNYVQSLQLLIEVFFTALQPILATQASEIIFANVEEILIFNTIFLSELEDRQRVSRLYVDSIGDVIKTHIRGLDVYRVYCVNQRNAANTLADLKSSDGNLKGTCDKLRVKGLELEHYLLEPMQRLTRYPLLISQILRYTPNEHEDHARLQSSLSIAEATLGVVNEAVRSRESEEKLLLLSEKLEFAGVNARLDLTAPTRHMGPRKVLKEGTVSKAKSGRQLNLYLFTDLLIFTEAHGSAEMVYKWPVPLDELSVRQNRRDDCSFQITHRGETFQLRVPTPRQRSNWEKDIGDARNACLKAKEQRRLSRS